MPVSAMSHFTILTDDVANTVRFYGDFLGLTEGFRPDFDFPGAWLYAGGVPILHVIGGKTKAYLRPGVIDHMAFSATGLAAMLEKLAAHGIEHTSQPLAAAGVWQVFFFDPNGARVELDFAATEAR
ncbi:MAG: VOC family protein [Betaproteobacteria bacterium]